MALTHTERRASPQQVLIVDGTLVPTRDRAVAASSKNYSGIHTFGIADRNATKPNLGYVIVA